MSQEMGIIDHIELNHPDKDPVGTPSGVQNR